MNLTRNDVKGASKEKSASMTHEKMARDAERIATQKSNDFGNTCVKNTTNIE